MIISRVPEHVAKVSNDYPELKELLENSEYLEGGCYILNQNEAFMKEVPLFYNYKIKHKQIDRYISRIKVDLSKCNDQSYNTKSKKHDNTYGWFRIKEQFSQGDRVNYFHRGHLIGHAISEYTKDFYVNHWENFVTLTNVCNTNNKINSLGMRFFEEIVEDTVKQEIDVEYQVIPVFKQKKEGKFEYFPRGIIIEAKTISGNFVGTNAQKLNLTHSDHFNVFIPNCQKELTIDYEESNVKINKIH